MDSRIPCKYGDKCYQKNSAHLNKYKHPQKNAKRKHNTQTRALKKIKLTEDTKKIEDLSDSSVSSDIETTEKTTNDNLDLDLTKKASISSSDSEQDNNETTNENEMSDNVDLENEAVSLNNEVVMKKKECISPSSSEQEDAPSDKELASHNVDAVDAEKGDAPVKQDTKPIFDNAEEKKTEEQISTAQNEPFDPKRFIKSRFLVDLPNDFFQFWDYCKELKPSNPSDAFKDVGLKLVGPYDVLAGKFKHVKRAPEAYFQHWRFYYDPPEVLTVLKGDNRTGYHIGYFYDSPEESPPFLVSNYGMKDGTFTKMSDNIFASVSLYLEELKRIGDPFKKMHVGKLLASIKTKAEKLKLNLAAQSSQMKEREKKVVAKTFNKIGLVVPYNKKTQLGYRDLAMSDKELLVLLNKLDKALPEQKSKYLSDLQPVFTYANIALDECDFGTGVKLGWELLYHGIDSLNSTITQFLCNSYRLLNKEAFAKITEAHMSNRKKGCDLSII